MRRLRSCFPMCQKAGGPPLNSPQVWVPHPCFFLARVGDDDPGSKNREWKFSVLPKVPIGIQMKAQSRFMPTHPSKEKIEGWGTRHNRRILLPIPLFGFAASHPWLEKSQGWGTQVIDRLRVGHPAHPPFDRKNRRMAHKCT